MPTPFHDLDDYIALTRVSGLAISPDGKRLVTTAQTLNSERTAYVSSLWEIDPTNTAAARQITHGDTSETNPTFTHDGDLLFTAAREKDKPAQLWRLPRTGGEATAECELPGGVSTPLAAKQAEQILVTTAMYPQAKTIEEDEQIRQERTDQKVDAILHTTYPIRSWDHDLGPDYPRLFTVVPEPADLTPTAGVNLADTTAAISDDGSFLVTSMRRPQARADQSTILVRVDIPSGEQTVLFEAFDSSHPHISPDGTKVAFLVTTPMDPHTAPDIQVWLMNSDGSNPRNLSGPWDRHASEITWLPDSSGLLLTADNDGRAPIFHLTLEGVIHQVTQEDAAFSNVVCATPTTAFAVMSSYEFPGEITKIDLAMGAVMRLHNPHERPQLPGTLQEVEATASDGTRIRSWLALPADPTPAPLLLWVHGGPVSSWNTWSWRWNPWLAVAQGYAVLLPDPGLSTGYGQGFIQRGWGAWGQEPYTDLLAAVDGACELPEIDASRTAAMGGSFGGYMANWIAGHTDRFKAIVTHASLWNLFTFGPTTDAAYFWAKEMTPEMVAANSPHTRVENIRTPMLVIHGDKDYRVPIGEGLALWYQLLADSGRPARDDGTSDHQFLYFPNENHWVLTPSHAKVWYSTVFEFLKTWV